MNQELMTLDFWQDTVIYEGKTFPVGTLACDALNVSADTLAQINEQCKKINLLLGMLDILIQTPPFSYMDIPKHRERIEKVFTVDICHTLLRNIKMQCLFLQKNQTATKQTVPQRASKKCSAAISRRKCKICGKWFLTTNARHTKYCGGYEETGKG